MLFSKFGEIVDVFLPQKDAKSRRRFGFVRYRNTGEIGRILSDINNIKVDDVSIKLDVPKDRGSSSPLLAKPPIQHKPHAAIGRSFAEAVLGSLVHPNPYQTLSVLSLLNPILLTYPSFPCLTQSDGCREMGIGWCFSLPLDKKSQQGGKALVANIDGRAYAISMAEVTMDYPVLISPETQ
ncbi:hypothetical protein Tsubulata_028415 [Turnera subulata]|uniref:RRM domain-containing protein n=1 Tax=Turnera subulata TaxID=218843 RepID=A0A9Q0G812_9ROSI|nr:hypothetical protein Tsubulata_028415 [Turnera subulata]